MLDALHYIWRVTCHAFWAWWDWVWGDTVTGLIATVGTAVVGAWLLPRISPYVPFLRRFVGDDTMDSVVNAGGLAIIFAVLSFVVFLIRAPHKIDSEQRKEIAQLKADLEAKDKAIAIDSARLSADIESEISVYAHLPPTGELGKLVAFMGSVRNLGQPSAVVGWRVTAVTPDGRKIIGQNYIPTEGIGLQTSLLKDGNTMYRSIGFNELLMTKCNAPIQRGDVKFGYVLAMFPGEDLPRDTNYIVEFSDVYGTAYSCNWDGSDGVVPSSNIFFQGEVPQSFIRNGE